ncbi:thiolase family protein [Neobacillus niacini]|uniref:thiolase family protein n=1 Tax=Neobacillus niacini TaxID=86668 RepID=UPI003000A379
MKEAVIIDAIRSPFGKYNGVLADVHPVDLLADVLKGLVERTGINPSEVDDIIGGCVHQHAEQGLNVTRNAWLAAGFPESVPAATIDRQCGSSLQAAHFAAQGVMAGAYDMVIACGVDSKTRVKADGSSRENSAWVPRLEERYPIDEPWFVPIKSADYIAKKWGFTRDNLDEYAFRSQHLASRAENERILEKQIIPITKRNGEVVKFDEGIRHDTKLEKVKSLNPVLPQLGVEMITAANSSQVTDGASAVLIMSADKAKELGLKPRARFVNFSAVGSDVMEWLTGPAPATQKVLKRAGLTVDDIDVFEVNEAFASVVLVWQKEIGAPMEKVNINGGAIAVGHPPGATGGRLICATLAALEQRNGRYGLIAICEGGAMANATIIERLP